MKLVLISLFVCVFIALSTARPQGGWQFPQQRPRPSRPDFNNGGGVNNGGFNNGGFNNGGFNNNNNGNGNPFLPNTTPRQTVNPVGSSTSATPTATTASPQFLACMQRCPTTSEYNPICGSDNQNYHNNGRLECAVRCGASVAAVRMGTCQAL